MINVGQVITDGTSKWVVQDIRDGAQCGDVDLQYILKVGWVKANGALLNRTDYPMLFDWASKKGILIDESLWKGDNQIYYSDGDGSTTFRVPKLTDLYVLNKDKVERIHAGLPNITGFFDLGNVNDNYQSLMTGPFSGTTKPRGDVVVRSQTANADTQPNTVWGTQFDASKSNPIYGSVNTVLSESIGLIPQIKYV